MSYTGENPIRYIIDNEGYYITVVQMTDIYGSWLEQPYFHSMKEGESLIEEKPPDGYVKPRWNGEAWEETGVLEITGEMVESLRTSKLQEINTVCQNVIYSGVDVETSFGIKHFSLTEPDQINLTGMATQMEKALAKQLEKALLGEPSSIDINKGVPYHADGELCRFWSPEDFAKIAYAATSFVFYHQTYCNHLRQYIKDISDYAELMAVNYGMELPAELHASMSELLGVDSL